MDALTDLRQKLTQAEHIVILAGAGMSSELGVPTYWDGANAQYGGERSPYGYTALQHASGPLWARKPKLQRTYFADQQRSLDNIDPTSKRSHYLLLLNYLTDRGLDYFIVTSNVDGFFIRAGFNPARVYEIHGAYTHSQCLRNPRNHNVFAATDTCPTCGKSTRPNVLFFDDKHMNPTRLKAQQREYQTFLQTVTPDHTMALEIGAGTTLPAVRRMSEVLTRRGIQLARVNPNPDHEPDSRLIHVPLTAGSALRTICQEKLVEQAVSMIS